MIDWITDYHHAWLVRLLGIALVLGAWTTCRLFVRQMWSSGRHKVHHQVAVPIPKRLVQSDEIGQCMAKEAATRPSLPVH